MGVTREGRVTESGFVSVRKETLTAVSSYWGYCCLSSFVISLPLWRVSQRKYEETEQTSCHVVEDAKNRFCAAWPFPSSVETGFEQGGKKLSGLYHFFSFQEREQASQREKLKKNSSSSSSSSLSLVHVPPPCLFGTAAEACHGFSSLSRCSCRRGELQKAFEAPGRGVQLCHQSIGLVVDTMAAAVCAIFLGATPSYLLLPLKSARWRNLHVIFDPLEVVPLASSPSVVLRSGY